MNKFFLELLDHGLGDGDYKPSQLMARGELLAHLMQRIVLQTVPRLFDHAERAAGRIMAIGAVWHTDKIGTICGFPDLGVDCIGDPCDIDSGL